MKIRTFILTAICIAIFINCSFAKTIELPLSHQIGYGHFGFNFGTISVYSEDKDDPWARTYLKATGVPKNWTDVKFGDIEPNAYQSAYQNYLCGNIAKEEFEKFKRRMEWIPDALALSKSH